MPETKLTKALVLEIKIPEFYAEDLQERADEFEIDVLEIVTEEMVRSEVGVSLVSLPGEKCLNGDFELINADGQIVGARIVDA